MTRFISGDRSLLEDTHSTATCHLHSSKRLIICKLNVTKLNSLVHAYDLFHSFIQYLVNSQN